MTPAFTFAIALSLLTALISGHIVSREQEDLYPLGAPGAISVTGGPGGDGEADLLLAVFDTADLSSARATYGTDADGETRTLAVAPGDRIPVTPDRLVAPGEPFPDRGTGLTTAVTTLDPAHDTVYGRWITFGPADVAREVAVQLEGLGFVVEVERNDSAAAASALSRWVPPPLWAGLLMLLLASATQSWHEDRRRRAVAVLHGESNLRVVVLTLGGWIAGVTGAVLAGAVVSGAVSVAAGNRQLLTASSHPWLLVLLLTATAVVAALCAGAVSSGALQARPLRRARARRGRQVVIVASGASVAALSLGVLASSDTVGAATNGVHAATVATEQWAGRPDMARLALRTVDEATQVRLAPAWAAFVADREAGGTVVLNELDDICGGLLLPAPCLTVNSTWLEASPEHRRWIEGAEDLAEARRTDVLVVIPSRLSRHEDDLVAHVRDLVAFQRELAEQQDCPATGCYADRPIAPVRPVIAPDGLRAELVTDSPLLGHEDGFVDDPVLIVVPTEAPALSGNAHLAAMSNGAELYVGAPDDVREDIRRHGLDDLIFSMSSSHDTTAALLPRAAAWLTESWARLGIHLAATALGVAVVTTTLLDRDRRRLVVERVHGRALVLRHRRIAAVAVTASAAVATLRMLSAPPPPPPWPTPPPDVVRAALETAGLSGAVALMAVPVIWLFERHALRRAERGRT
jgi:hypothetical protein